MPNGVLRGEHSGLVGGVVDGSDFDEGGVVGRKIVQRPPGVGGGLLSAFRDGLGEADGCGGDLEGIPASEFDGGLQRRRHVVMERKCCDVDRRDSGNRSDGAQRDGLVDGEVPLASEGVAE